MSEVNSKDWCEKPRVTNTVGNGWCVRISGTDVFDNINQYGCKTLRAFDVVRGLSSEQEAKAYLVLWLRGQLLEQGDLLGSDAQRLRADTAEAELTKFDEGLRAIASSLGAGGYNAEKLTADQLIGKVQWGIDYLVRIQEQRLATAALNGPAK